MSQEFDIGDWVYIDKEKQKYGQIIDQNHELYKIKATQCVIIDDKTCNLDTFHPNYNTKWMEKTHFSHMRIKKTKGRIVKQSRG
jgi:hypothetical protein